MTEEQKPVRPIDLLRAKLKNEFVSDEVAAERFSICRSCPELRTKTNFRGVKDTCKQCNCYMPEKTRLPGAYCPMVPPRWETAPTAN